MKTVITYGTFDLFHVGHLRMLEGLRGLGDRLIVGVSTDEFNAGKGKTAMIPFDQRAEIVNGLKCVDMVIPEVSWDQKILDINQYGVSIFGIGEDWKGKFDYLLKYCEVVYLPRTRNISSTMLRFLANAVAQNSSNNLQDAQAIIRAILVDFEGESK